MKDKAAYVKQFNEAISKPIKVYEVRLLSFFLTELSNRMSRAGCNDFDITTLQLDPDDIDDLIQNYGAYMMTACGGWTPEMSEALTDTNYLDGFCVVDYLNERIVAAGLAAAQDANVPLRTDPDPDPQPEKDRRPFTCTPKRWRVG